jgi:hypothetical protein
VSLEDYTRLPRARRLAHLERTPGRLADAVRGQAPEVLARRPGPASWAPIEVICHLRDLEESFLERIRQILLMDEPRFVTTNPNRWAEERQYLRHDGEAALAAFSRRRRETLEVLHHLRPEEWDRAGYQQDSRGRRTVDDFVGLMAWHDDNHLQQLARGLEGRP